jgi:transportin-3
VCLLACHRQYLIVLRKHLVPFISELHAFTANVGTKLGQEDKVVVYEAIAHVISAMPMDQAAQSLKTFASTILAVVFTSASKPGAATKQELQEVGSAFFFFVFDNHSLI